VNLAYDRANTGVSRAADEGSFESAAEII